MVQCTYNMSKKCRFLLRTLHTGRSTLLTLVGSRPTLPLSASHIPTLPATQTLAGRLTYHCLFTSLPPHTLTLCGRSKRKVLETTRASLITKPRQVSLSSLCINPLHGPTIQMQTNEVHLAHYMYDNSNRSLWLPQCTAMTTSGTQTLVKSVLVQLGRWTRAEKLTWHLHLISTMDKSYYVCVKNVYHADTGTTYTRTGSQKELQ